MENNKIGFIVFAQRVGDRPLKAVRDAALKNNLNADYVHDVRPRNAFIRAAQALVKAGLFEHGNKGLLRDKIADSTQLCYQFSKRVVQENQATYPAQCVIRFDKRTSVIAVEGVSYEEGLAVQRKVKELFDEYAFIVKATDFHNIIDRIFRDVTKRISIRPGVFFIPVRFLDLLNQVRAFHEALGFTFSVYSVGAQDDLAKKDLFRAITEDVVKEIDALKTEITDLQNLTALNVEETGLTRRKAKNRIEELSKALEQYKSLGNTLNVSVDKILEAAGDSGKTLRAVAAAQLGQAALIQHIQSAGEADPIAALLLDKVVSDDGGFFKALADEGYPNVAVGLAEALAQPISPESETEETRAPQLTA